MIVDEIPVKLWIQVIVNFIIKLPLIAEKDIILVMCNRLFKIIY